MLKGKQLVAYDRIEKWLYERNRFFRLMGYSGTGKTFLLKHFDESHQHLDVAYTTPTNKATKILARTLGHPMSCATIYSLLGIRMVAHEERLVLEFPRRPVDISRYDVIVVDESSMLNTELVDYIDKISFQNHARWLFVGDRAQLNPVGEKISPVWTIDCDEYELDEVLRHDNQILEFVTHIRSLIQKYSQKRDARVRIKSNHAKGEGVWHVTNKNFVKYIKRAADQGLFTEVDRVKVIAWRNRRVDQINEIVRNQLFGRIAQREQLLIGDRVMLRDPVTAGRQVIANVDDEGTISSVGVGHHAFHRDIKAYHVVLSLDDGRALDLQIVHPESVGLLADRLNALAVDAKAGRSPWSHFWGLKESFHNLRYSHALTGHRSQGSTYESVLIDSGDILENSDELEALRCLYVGCSRATTKLVVL